MMQHLSIVVSILYCTILTCLDILYLRHLQHPSLVMRLFEENLLLNNLRNTKSILFLIVESVFRVPVVDVHLHRRFLKIHYQGRIEYAACH